MNSLGSAAMRNAERSVALMYHRVGDALNDWERRYCVEPRRFAQQMRALHDRGYRACGIDSYVDWLMGRGKLPEGRFLLTFDDGFLGVYEHARPVLLELGWTATVFLVTQLIGMDDVWDEPNSPSPRRHKLLGRAQIEQMEREGFSFHSHSRHHLDLTALDDAKLIDELAGSRRDVEELLGQPARYLAYPFGRYDPRVHQAASAAGYAAAFCSAPGFNRPRRDPMTILRLDVAGTDAPAAWVRKVRLGINDGSARSMARYAIGRAASRLGVGAP